MCISEIFCYSNLLVQSFKINLFYSDLEIETPSYIIQQNIETFPVEHLKTLQTSKMFLQNKKEEKSEQTQPDNFHKVKKLLQFAEVDILVTNSRNKTHKPDQIFDKLKFCTNSLRQRCKFHLQNPFLFTFPSLKTLVKIHQLNKHEN